MKYDFDKVLIDLDGIPFRMSADSKADSTYRDVITMALNGVFEDERQLSGEEKNKRFAIMIDIHGSGRHDTPHVDLKTEDVALIKKCIGKMFPPLIVGRVYRFLEKEMLDDRQDARIDPIRHRG